MWTHCGRHHQLRLRLRLRLRPSRQTQTQHRLTQVPALIQVSTQTQHKLIQVSPQNQNKSIRATPQPRALQNWRKRAKKPRHCPSKAPLRHGLARQRALLRLTLLQPRLPMLHLRLLTLHLRLRLRLPTLRLRLRLLTLDLCRRLRLPMLHLRLPTLRLRLRLSQCRRQLRTHHHPCLCLSQDTTRHLYHH